MEKTKSWNLQTTHNHFLEYLTWKRKSKPVSASGWEVPEMLKQVFLFRPTSYLYRMTHMFSAAVFRDTLYKSFHKCFCLAAFFPCSNPGVRKSFPLYLSAKDANFLHPFTGFPDKNTPISQAALVQKHFPWHAQVSISPSSTPWNPSPRSISQSSLPVIMRP